MSSRVVILPVKDFVERALTTPPFLVDPYIPTGGIVLLYGKAGIGKTPLSWEVSHCVATGRPFLGLPTRQATVLYVDVDTPEAQIVQRMKALPNLPAVGWHMAWSTPFNVLSNQDPVTKELTHWGHSHTPQFVVLNTLRKMYRGDDRESWLPSQVYGAFTHMFPGAAIWINHHDKKTGDPTVARNEDEDFAGSQAWMNDATTTLHLMRRTGTADSLYLKHTKSQVSAQHPPLVLRLTMDGCGVTVFDYDAEVWAAFCATNPGLKIKERLQLVAEQMGRSLSGVTAAYSRAKAQQETSSDGQV